MFNTHNKSVENNTTTNVEASVSAKLVRQSKISHFKRIKIGSDDDKSIQRGEIKTGVKRVGSGYNTSFKDIYTKIRIIQLVYVTKDMYHIEYELIEEQDND